MTMTKTKKNHRVRTENRRKAIRLGFLCLAIAIGVVALVVRILGPSQSPATSTQPERGVSYTNAVAAGSESRSRFQKLLGKWVRPDGGYILEIRSADEQGELDAGYFNPNPIHVAQAQASEQGSWIKVFIELRDVNYPGSTYTLAYDSAADQLKGVYFQAVERQQFEIQFERMK